MTQAEDRAQHSAKQLSQLEGRLVQVAEVSPEPVQQLTASVDELRSKMASTPWTQDRGLFKSLEFGDMRPFLVTVCRSYFRNLTNVKERALRAALVCEKGWIGYSSSAWGATLVEVACLVCKIEGSFACFEDIAALQERLATAEEAVEAAAGRLAQLTEVSPETLRQLAASVDELRSKMASTPWTQDRGLFKSRMAFSTTA